MMKLSIKQEGVLPPPSVIANAKVEIWRDTNGAIYAYGETHGDECWMHVPGIASYRFTRQGTDIDASVVDGVRTDLVLDAYRRRVLPMAVQVRGCEVLHASAITTNQGVVAFCGVSQTGKSTIAFGLAQRGFDIWCDDALAFEISGGRPRTLSLPFELRLRPAASELFRHAQPAVSPSGMSEAGAPGSKTASLTAICVLSRTAETDVRVTVTRLSFAESFVALLDHAFWFSFQTSDDKRRLVRDYMDLAAEIPVFGITFNSGAHNLVATLDAIEAQVTGAAHV